MAERDKYFQQSRLLLNVLTSIDPGDFALKGGTAINFYYRDYPRLSVDIDLAYTRILSRAESLQNIHQGLHSIRKTLDSLGYKALMTNADQDNPAVKMVVSDDNSSIIIEPNSTLRGTLFPVKSRPLTKAAVDIFKVAGSFPCLDERELYAGKLNAMLDRQHPRDIFDMLIFYDGNSSLAAIMDAFVAYLIQGSRPLSEILSPNLIDISDSFGTSFQGMTDREVTLDQLLATRTKAITEVQNSLTADHKQFLLSLMDGQPDWELMPFAVLQELPAVNWKLLNIQKMARSKRAAEIKKLEELFKA